MKNVKEIVRIIETAEAIKTGDAKKVAAALNYPVQAVRNAIKRGARAGILDAGDGPSWVAPTAKGFGFMIDFDEAREKFDNLTTWQIYKRGTAFSELPDTEVERLKAEMMIDIRESVTYSIPVNFENDLVATRLVVDGLIKVVRNPGKDYGRSAKLTPKGVQHNWPADAPADLQTQVISCSLGTVHETTLTKNQVELLTEIRDYQDKPKNKPRGGIYLFGWNLNTIKSLVNRGLIELDALKLTCQHTRKTEGEPWNGPARLTRDGELELALNTPTDRPGITPLGQVKPLPRKVPCLRLVVQERSVVDKFLFTFTCQLTGETQSVVACASCAKVMSPAEDGRVSIVDADPECDCEFCGSIAEKVQPASVVVDDSEQATAAVPTNKIDLARAVVQLNDQLTDLPAVDDPRVRAELMAPFFSLRNAYVRKLKEVK